jgi:hypothetical protein
MSGREAHLDHALELLASEMEALREEDFEKARKLAFERGEALRKGCEPAGADKSEAILRRLERINTMHGRLISETQNIRERVREDLLRLRSERQRLNGYKEARRITPPASSLLSRKG